MYYLLPWSYNYDYIIYFLKTIGFLPISAEKFAGLIDKNQKKNIITLVVYIFKQKIKDMADIINKALSYLFLSKKSEDRRLIKC